MSGRPARILLIDDDPLVQRIGLRLFASPDYACTVAGTAAEALKQLPLTKPDVVVLDHLLPDCTGIDLLRQIHTFDSRLPVILITVAGTSGNTIEAMKRGAFDFLAKPLDLDLLAAHVKRALESRRLMLTPVEMADANVTVEAGHVLVGQSDAMREVYKAIGRVATQNCPALITGEPGTGKELVARLIYENGLRSRGPLLTIKCNDFALPWLESELFGHEPGAFAGAVNPRVGKVEQGRGGVLLLKEVGDLPLATQSKLVDLLRHRRFQRLGSSEYLLSDVTVLATASEDLSAAVAEGRFQADLFYALGSFNIAMPSLRQRPSDIPLLIDHFMKRLSRIQRTFSSEVPRVSEEALAHLSHYSWPGNIDELQSVLKRGIIEGKGTVQLTPSLVQSLQRPVMSDAGPHAEITNWRALLEQGMAAASDDLYNSALTEMERRFLPLVMQVSGGSQVKAARALGITRGSLRKKLRLHGFLAKAGETADDFEETSAAKEG